MNSDVFRLKHSTWLAILFGSFAIQNESVSKELYEFSTIAFRHMRWLSRELKALHVEYNYDRDELNIEHYHLHDILNGIIEQIESTTFYYTDEAIFERIKTDEEYILSRLNTLIETHEDERVIAFDRELIYDNKNLDEKQISALVKFLFEELYKEYELILIYSYMQNYTTSLLENDIFQDLIDESQFHLKCFGEMMAKVGILALPRQLHEKTYKIEDVSKFIVDGIEEELNAKEMCRALSSEIKDKELSKFFDFINHQESYHIELMKKLLV